MKELKNETGVEEYDLNGKCKVYFNPADPAFADRIYTAFDKLKGKQGDKDTSGMSARETFDYLRALDEEMRETIDSVFEQPVCAELFGSMSVYAGAGGTPLWMNFMLAVIDELDEGVKREKAFHSEKLAKYTKKYHR